MTMLSEKAKTLILSMEGMDQPGKWPGGDSGVTLGRGYDLGYITEEEFEEDWRYYLSADQMERLKVAIGVKGQVAKGIASLFSDIKIRAQDADEVFGNSTLPKFEEMTMRAFPGCERLPPDAFGALVSLVYNRGPDTSNTDRRMEMRAIKEIVPKYGDTPEDRSRDNAILRDIADQIRSMKRLWINKGLDGLLRRRDAEASLVESCIF